MADWHADPRPDIIADHALWQTLLSRTDDAETGWLLHGMRAAGTTIVLCEDGVPRLKPLIDPARGFASDEAWQDFKHRYLALDTRRIAQALNVLTEHAGM
ncbi:hypothetical protein [Alicyclobacillus macrosporangiidus]|uniref:hypothetical protein n=1 Tax=Alicyclobacillus macrosporangiidus TaxID=392015 RepID=UPI0004953ECD|nr:hypothetical protein [Alicyclobacillus macrosporangiidus]